MEKEVILISSNDVWAMLPDKIDAYLTQAASTGGIEIGCIGVGNESRQSFFFDSGFVSVDEFTRLEVRNGIALMTIVGGIFKGRFFGSGMLRKKIAFAEASNDIKGMLLKVDSPGGELHATEELSDSIKSFASKKPIVTQVEGLAASAAFWIASDTNKIFATPLSFVGSIGVFSIIGDFSKMLNKAGIKVHVISNPKEKGQGTGLVKIEKTVLDRTKARVDFFADKFRSVVIEGRGLTPDQQKAAFNADVFNANDSLNMGLIDGIQGLGITFDDFDKEINGSARDRSKRRRASISNRLQLAKHI